MSPGSGGDQARATAADGAQAPARSGWHARPRWLRSTVEVGLPLVVVIAVAVAVFTSGGGSRRLVGGLSYDRRARPLLLSLSVARQARLLPGETMATGQGGCNGSRAVWACDLEVSTRSHRQTVETYNVRWNQNGCWGATEDCLRPVATNRQLCPPPVVTSLQGCITAAQAAATG